MNPNAQTIHDPAAHPRIAIPDWNVPKKRASTAAVPNNLDPLTVPAASETAKQSIARATAMTSSVQGSMDQYQFALAISIIQDFFQK
jgi:valyl-tRNA synthetase